MLDKIKIFILIIMISFIGSKNNVHADDDKLAYDFAFKDLDGGPLKLADFKNKMIQVNVLPYVLKKLTKLLIPEV